MSIEVFRGLPIVEQGEILQLATASDLPITPDIPVGSVRHILDEDTIYQYTSSGWIAIGSGGGGRRSL